MHIMHKFYKMHASGSKHEMYKCLQWSLHPWGASWVWGSKDVLKCLIFVAWDREPICGYIQIRWIVDGKNLITYYRPLTLLYLATVSTFVILAFKIDFSDNPYPLLADVCPL